MAQPISDAQTIALDAEAPRSADAGASLQVLLKQVFGRLAEIDPRTPKSSVNYAEDSPNHSALLYGILGGSVMKGVTGFVSGTAGYEDNARATLPMTDDILNYVELGLTGTVTVNTVGFTAGRLPLATVLTASGVITTVTDKSRIKR